MQFLGCQRSALALRGPPFWKQLGPKNVDDVLLQGTAPVVKPAIFPVHTGNPWKTCNGQYMHGIAAGILSNKPVTLITTAAPTPPSQESLETQTLSTHNESPVCAAVEFFVRHGCLIFAGDC